MPKSKKTRLEKARAGYRVSNKLMYISFAAASVALTCLVVACAVGAFNINPVVSNNLGAALLGSMAVLFLLGLLALVVRIGYASDIRTERMVAQIERDRARNLY